MIDTLPTTAAAPPQNLDAEKSVLGAILLDSLAMSRVVSAGLRPEHFYRDAHQKVFLALSDLAAKGIELDIVTVKDELARRGHMDSIGGPAYLTGLVDGVPDVANVEYYAGIVKEKSVRRRLIAAGQAAAREGLSGTSLTDELLDKMERELFEISDDRVQAGFQTIDVIADENLDQLEARAKRGGDVTGVSTGFEIFDQMTSGFQPSDLIIIAARPSMGKTSFCLNIAEHMAIKEQKVVAFFSLEMAKEQLGMRVLCSLSGVSGRRLRGGYVGERDWNELGAARRKLDGAPLYINDTAGMSVLEMRSLVRRLVMEKGRIDCVMVDYLQLIHEKTRFENRNLEIGAISRGLKALAKDFKIPVVALSQLSRAPERRTGDHRPQLADLRESGSIEQDADLVAFIYRDEMYDRDSEKKGEAEIIIAKQRNGPVGSFSLAFLHDLTRFQNLERAPDMG